MYFFIKYYFIKLYRVWNGCGNKVQYLVYSYKVLTYRTIRLENGLTALLISDPSRAATTEDTSSSEEETSGSDESSGSESDSGKSVQSAISDHHGSKRTAEFDEEKLVCFLYIYIIFFYGFSL